MKLKDIFFGLTLAAASSSSLANYVCTGAVSGVGIDPKSGAVLVERIGTLEWPRLCSVETETNGTSVDACKVIYSTLLTAQTAKKNVRLWFNDDKGCTKQSHTPWENLTGWYFGPVLTD